MKKSVLEVNNPKLKKLLENSIPLTVKPKHQRKSKEIPFERYPHIPLLSSNRIIKSLLGKRLMWTVKEDGECVTMWLKKKKRGESRLFTGMVDLPLTMKLVISSRNQENASGNITSKVQGTEEYFKILQLLTDNPTLRIIVEECRKGRSVTGIKTYERDILFIVDIFDTTINNFLSYVAVHQYAYHYGLPIVKLYAETRHLTIKDLLKFKNHVLEYCDSQKDYGKDEGMVIKTFGEDGEYLQAKVKLDVPEPIVRKIREGKPIFPVMPDNEVFGAISKVEADHGLTGEAKHDMPLIARYVEEACKEHLFSKPKRNYFSYYQEYMERMKKCQ